MNKAEQLLADIYGDFLSHTGDRYLYPCNKIGDYFKSKGIDIVKLEDEWEKLARAILNKKEE